MTTIACLGDIDIDLLVDVDRFPARGEESFAENSLIRPDVTGMNVVVTDPDGERTMIGLRGANRSFGGTWAHQGAWLHVSAYALLEGDQRKAALAILEQARREGVPISMDVPSGVARALGPQLVPVFHGVTLLTVGRRSLDPIRGAAAA